MNEPGNPAADAAEATAVAAAVLRNSRIHLSAGVLAIVALGAALYLARGFVVPLLIGILASYALHPGVDWLKTWRAPRRSRLRAQSASCS